MSDDYDRNQFTERQRKLIAFLQRQLGYSDEQVNGVVERATGKTMNTIRRMDASKVIAELQRIRQFGQHAIDHPYHQAGDPAMTDTTDPDRTDAPMPDPAAEAMEPIGPHYGTMTYRTDGSRMLTSLDQMTEDEARAEAARRRKFDFVGRVRVIRYTAEDVTDGDPAAEAQREYKAQIEEIIWDEFGGDEYEGSWVASVARRIAALPRPGGSGDVEPAIMQVFYDSPALARIPADEARDIARKIAGGVRPTERGTADTARINRILSGIRLNALPVGKVIRASTTLGTSPSDVDLIERDVNALAAKLAEAEAALELTNDNLDIAMLNNASFAETIEEMKAELAAERGRAGIYAAIDAERARQDAKWGEQNHPDPYWLGIAMEEVGEVAKAVIEHKPDEVRSEIVHALAVLVQWYEAMQRRDLDAPEEPR